MIDKYSYTLTEEERERTTNINDFVVDLTKHFDNDVDGAKGSDSFSEEEREEEKEIQDEKDGEAGGGKPSGTFKPFQPKITGGHSTKSERVRGLENTFMGKYEFVDAAKWIRSGAYPNTREEVMATGKWIQFSSTYKKLKKKLRELQNEEISETERNNIIGSDVNINDYVTGREKYFDKVIVPEKETKEINVILALDASGSTGSDRQYNMSGVALATKKALEETKIQHSFMIFDHTISLLDVDRKGRSSSSNILAGNMTGSGGNSEEMVLEISGEIARRNTDKKNIVIIISDGGVSNVREELQKLKDKHIMNPMNVYLVGYGDSFDELYGAKIFGDKFTIGTKNNADYAKKLNGILLKELESTLTGGE